MTALSLSYRKSEWTLALGMALGCSLGCAGGQSEAETPQQQAYPPQPGAYPQQPGAYPQQPGAYPQQPGAYPQQPGTYPPQQQQPYPQQPGTYPPQQQTPYPQTPGATPPATLPPTGLPPVGGALPTAPTGPLATPIDPSAASAVQPLLTQLASSKASPGAKPIGSVMAANFQQGQQLEAQIQMEPGKCYTVVGAGLPPVTELDLKLVAVTPMAGMAPVLAVDNTTGAQAVLGEKPNCYKWAWPIAAPVKVIVTMTGGSGLAAAQLFGK